MQLFSLLKYNTLGAFIGTPRKVSLHSSLMVYKSGVHDWSDNNSFLQFSFKFVYIIELNSCMSSPSVLGIYMMHVWRVEFVNIAL